LEEDRDQTKSEEYIEAILDPEKFPLETRFNIDPECDYVTMFNDEHEQEEFFAAIEQACYL
jgi:hypothetical protein